jgi:Tol biopolymer transport system component
MKQRLFTILILAGLFLSSCQRRILVLPPQMDLVIAGWTNGWLGSTKPYIVATSSSGSGITGEIDPSLTGSHMEWSPDGQWILAIMEDNKQLVVIEASTGAILRVLVMSDASRLTDASWSPDSSSIVYAVRNQGRTDIRWVDIQCLQAGQACSNQEHFVHYGADPDWSPDGRSIAFVWDARTNIQGQGKDAVYIMSADGSGTPNKISGNLEDCHDPDWSPDSARIVFSCNFDIYPDDVQPSWSPRGDRIAFLSQRDTGGLYIGDLDAPRSNALYTMDPDGNNIERITFRDDVAISWYAWVITP